MSHSDWPGVRIQMLCLALGVTAMTLLGALVVPMPLGFWLLIGALVVGPGIGLPHVLFPTGSLSPPEALLVAAVGGFLVDDAAYFALNAQGVELTRTVVGGILLLTTYLSACAGAIASERYAVSTDRPHRAQWHLWVAFGAGITIVVAVAVVAAASRGQTL